MQIVAAYWGTITSTIFVPLLLALVNHNVGNAKYQTWFHVLLDLLSPKSAAGQPVRFVGQEPGTGTRATMGWMLPLVMRTDRSPVMAVAKEGVGPINIALLCLAAASVAGCAHARDQATLVKGAASAAISSSAVAWIEYDHKHQLDIVQSLPTPALRVDALAQYRSSVQEPVQKAFHVAQAALEALDLALKAVDAGKRGDWASLITPLIDGIKQIGAAFKAAGISIPVPEVN